MTPLDGPECGRSRRSPMPQHSANRNQFRLNHKRNRFRLQVWQEEGRD
jgi:hypothetical protein